MTSIVSNTLSFFSLSPFFSFLLLALPWRLVPRIPSIAYPSARFLLAGALVHHLGRHMQTQLQCKAQPRFLPSFCWVFLMRPGEPRRPVRMGWGGCTAFSLQPRPFPRAPVQGCGTWKSKQKSQIGISNRQGGGDNTPDPHPQATRQSPKLDRSRLDSLWPASSYTPFSPAHTLRICTSLLHLSGPPGIRTRRIGVTPNPYPFIIPTLLVIPRFSCRCWLLALLAASASAAFLFSTACYCHCVPYLTYPLTLSGPPLLLHLFLDRLTASPRLALHHLRQLPARATSSRFPPSRHHWNEQ